LNFEPKHYQPDHLALLQQVEHGIWIQDHAPGKMDRQVLLRSGVGHRDHTCWTWSLAPLLKRALWAGFSLFGKRGLTFRR
jgi:hypothetical protein